MDPGTNFGALTESAKALLNAVLGESQCDDFRDTMDSYLQLDAENKELKAELASLQENPPYKDKYTNLRKEFAKVAAERDSLRAMELRCQSAEANLQRCSSAYQQLQAKLASMESAAETHRFSASANSLLEDIYQLFKQQCNKHGVETSRVPTLVGLQFQLQNETHTGAAYYWLRQSKDKWVRVNPHQH